MPASDTMSPPPVKAGSVPGAGSSHDGLESDDAVTAVFMHQFYRALQRGLSPAQALGDAQSAVACSHPHPAFWAGFVLFGGW